MNKDLGIKVFSKVKFIIVFKNGNYVNIQQWKNG